MRAMVIHDFGGTDQIKQADLPRPQPSETQVLVKIAYAGVNPVDWKIRKGILKGRGLPHEFPIVLGWDTAGQVAEAGAKVTGFMPGDKVFAYCRKPVVQGGTYAEFISLEASSVAMMPKSLSFAQAAAIPLTALTAWQSLFDAVKLKEGEKILIHAGAGGVGGMAIQFAKYAGAKVYTTAQKLNHAYVKGLGADMAIDYTKENFVEAIRKQEPEGLDVVFDTVGGETEKKSFNVLKKGGRLVAILQQPDRATAEARGIKVSYVFVSPNGRQLAEIAALIEKGAVRPPEITEMDLSEAAKAHELSESRHVRGKIVLKI